MENQILTDPMVIPGDAVLEEALGKKYKLFESFKQKTAEQGLILEWNYYRDTKSWLCKVLHKKKNLCWLSVWNTGFQLTFYFPAKVIDGVYELDINEEIIKAAKELKPAGKSHPVRFSIKNNKMIKDALKLLEHKKNLK